MQSIKVKDVMFHEPFMVKPAQSVSEAAELMKDIDCGALPVGDPDKPIGIITDRDIALRVTAEGKDPAKTFVRDVMTKSLQTCDEEDSLEDVARLMQQHDVKRVVVTKGGKKATGIVTLKRLLKNTGDVKVGEDILHIFMNAPSGNGISRHLR